MTLELFTAIYLTIGAAFSAICANMVLDRNLSQYANIAAFIILGLLWPVFAAPAILSAIKKYWFISLLFLLLTISLCSCATQKAAQTNSEVCTQKIHPYCVYCSHYPCLCK